ncbi:MAG TPA: DEAD/DEAH box helicase, partial [Vicinamibacteria bacterium]
PLSSFRSRRVAPPSASGRWSRLPIPNPKGTGTGPTAGLVARAEQLLARHGVLTRDALASEGIPGGFAALYPVLRAMEESGRARRGYFVAGFGGSQFAHPGALDRLRALRETPEGEEPLAVVLSACDPANAHGAALPWPRTEAARPARVPGAHVVLVDGVLVAYLTRGDREAWVWLEEGPGFERVGRAAARALREWTARTARTVLAWDAGPGSLARSPLAPFLEEAGFAPSGTGFRLKG